MTSLLRNTLYIGLILACAYPVAVQASWKDPFIWIVTGKYTAPSSISGAPFATTSATVSATTSASFAAPTTGELLKRIAELEDKLDKALAQNALMAQASEVLLTRQASVASVSKTSVAPSNISDKDLITKVRPAIVSVDTATSSGSGVIIDSLGRILVSSHVLLVRDTSGAAIGVNEAATITFSNGSTKSAKLVGFNESEDVAVMQLEGGKASSYVKAGDAAQVKRGDRAYVFASPASRVSSGGIDIVSGTISQNTGNSLELVADSKPLENAAAFINSRGEVVAVPEGSVCKVLEEGQKCLTYKITANVISQYLPKISEGMRLYKNKKTRTADEFLVLGQLEGVRGNMNSNGSLQYGISSLSGKNSFDTFNAKLVDDQDGKITKLYLNKLKVGADSMVKAIDSLKDTSHNLDIFFIDNTASILTLGDYQKKILARMETVNRLKYKEYEAKVNYWSAKKNEYDTLITKSTDATHDYLTLEGAAMESAVSYLVSEQKRVMDSVSSEILGLF